MKQNKSILYLLAVMIMLSFSQAAVASEPNDVVYTDEFDFTYLEEAPADYTSGNTGYPSTWWNRTYPDNKIISDVFVGENAVGKPTLDNTAGKTNGALVYEGISQANFTSFHQRTKTIDMSQKTPGSIVEFSHDFCILREPNNTYIDTSNEWKNGRVQLGTSADGAHLLNLEYVGGTESEGKISGGDWKFKDYSSGNTVDYEVGTWYNITVRQLPLSGREYVVTDAITGEEIISGEHPTYSYPGYFNLLRLDSAYLTDETQTFKIAFDNAKLKVYDPTVTSATLEIHNVDTTDMARNKKLNFHFSQPVSGDLVLTKTEDGSIVDTDTIVSVLGDLTLSWDGMLERKKEYSLSFGDITNGTLQCDLSPIVFTTEDLHIWDDIEISPVSATTDSTPITVGLKLNDKYNYPNFTGSVIATVYKDDIMIGMDMISLTNENTSSIINKSFQLGSIPSGATLELTLLDVVNSPIPLAVGQVIVQ